MADGNIDEVLGRNEAGAQPPSFVKIPEEERPELARAFESSSLKCLSEFLPISSVRMEQATGENTLRRYEPSFKKIDGKVQAWLESTGRTRKAFYSATAEYVIEKCGCRSLQQCRSYLRAIFKNPNNQRKVATYMVARAEEFKKNKDVINSVLLSIAGLCELTFKKERVSRPSTMFQTIVDNGSLGRYLGGTFSYHFTSLIPNIGEMIERTAGTEIDYKNVRKRRMSEEYTQFYNSIARYKYEAEQALRTIKGNNILIKGVLPFADEYYYKHYLPEHSGAIINEKAGV